jgi:hypothetical protein
VTQLGVRWNIELVGRARAVKTVLALEADAQTIGAR